MLLVNFTAMKNKLLKSQKQVNLIYQNILQEQLKFKAKIKVNLAIIWIGDNFSTKIFIKNKIKICQKLNFSSSLYHFSKINFNQLKSLINKLNQSKDIHGILLQLPLPEELKLYEKKITSLISKEKDVDCFNLLNYGKFCQNFDINTYPCIVKATQILLDDYHIATKSKNILIISNSNLIGKPLTNFFLFKNATIIVCNIFTKKIKKFLKISDIIFSATGVQNFFKPKDIKKNCIIFDLGINKNSKNKITGDLKYQKFLKKVRYITPVPGGIGPLTIAVLMQNLWNLYLKQIKK